MSLMYVSDIHVFNSATEGVGHCSIMDGLFA